MANKKLRARIQLKHDTEANWNAASTFAPLPGEVVVFEPDDTHEYSRFKVGRKKSDTENYLLSELPFITDQFPKLSSTNIFTDSNTFNRTLTAKYGVAVPAFSGTAQTTYGSGSISVRSSSLYTKNYVFPEGTGSIGGGTNVIVATTDDTPIIIKKTIDALPSSTTTTVSVSFTADEQNKIKNSFERVILVIGTSSTPVVLYPQQGSSILWYFASGIQNKVYYTLNLTSGIGMFVYNALPESGGTLITIDKSSEYNSADDISSFTYTTSITNYTAMNGSDAINTRLAIKTANVDYLLTYNNEQIYTCMDEMGNILFAYCELNGNVATIYVNVTKYVVSGANNTFTGINKFIVPETFAATATDDEGFMVTSSNRSPGKEYLKLGFSGTSPVIKARDGTRMKDVSLLFPTKETGNYTIATLDDVKTAHYINIISNDYQLYLTLVDNDSRAITNVRELITHLSKIVEGSEKCIPASGYYKVGSTIYNLYCVGYKSLELLYAEYMENAITNQLVIGSGTSVTEYKV